MDVLVARLKPLPGGHFRALCGKLAYGRRGDVMQHCDGALAELGHVATDLELASCVGTWRINRKLAGLPIVDTNGWVAWHRDKL